MISISFWTVLLLQKKHPCGTIPVAMWSPLLVRHGDTEWVDGEKKLAGNVCHGGSKRAVA